MSWELDFDFASFYDHICIMKLENKPIIKMSKNEIENLINSVKAHLKIKCLHCSQYRPQYLHGMSGTCALTGSKIEDALKHCRLAYDQVPF